MASTWGRDRGEPRYDKFRSGLTFAQVRQMSGPNDDVANARDRHNRKRRNGVLGYWHELKLLAFLLQNPRSKLRRYAPATVERQLRDLLERAA